MQGRKETGKRRGSEAVSLHDVLEDEGYAIAPDRIQADTLARVANDFAHAAERRSRAGIRHAMAFDSVAQTAQDPRILDIAQEILGQPAIPFRATLFDKSPASNWLIVWHQDTALPLKHRRDVPGWGPWSIKDGVNYAHAPAEVLSGVIALRIHLDDSTLQNGPLRVLPRTHQLGLLTDDQIQALARDTKDVSCIVDAGGIVAMRPLLLHASSKSQTDAPRRVLHIEYTCSLILPSKLELAVC